jgi:hypothetical protein
VWASEGWSVTIVVSDEDASAFRLLRLDPR